MIANRGRSDIEFPGGQLVRVAFECQVDNLLLARREYLATERLEYGAKACVEGIGIGVGRCEVCRTKF